MSQFPIQFTKPLRRGEPFKMRPRIETPTTDSPIEELLVALAEAERVVRSRR